MGNFGATIKKFFTNKNTITILGVLLGIIVLYAGYNYRVKSAVSKTTVPISKNTLVATTQITSNDITTTEVLSSMVEGKSSTIIKNTNDLINQTDPYCVAVGTSIPNGAFFYTEQVVKCTTIQSNVLKNMPDGYRPVSISVDLQSTYGNSMYPGDYIDLYVRMKDEDGKLIYGKLVEKLPILDVRDSSGKSVFATSQVGTPAILLFAVPNQLDGNNLYLLLSNAVLLGKNIVELIPVPGNATYTSETGETRVTNQYLMDTILDYTADIPYEDSVDY